MTPGGVFAIIPVSENRKGVGKKMNGANRGGSCLRGILAACLACVFLLPFPNAVSEQGAPKLRVSMPKEIKGYTPCEIVIESSFAGEAELKLLDLADNLWLVRRETVSEGRNVLVWDGLGANRERMFAGPYHFNVTVRAEDGTEAFAKAKFEINGTTQTLVYALPSSEKLYLDRGEKWFVEVFVSAECTVAMELTDEAGEQAFYREFQVSGRDGEPIPWNGSLDTRTRIAPGTYTVRMWSKLNPDYDHTFPLTVEETTPPVPEVAATGPVLPERGMSDEEIWEIMMKPSVVIKGVGSSREFGLYAKQNTGSRSIATLRCALQGMEVLDTEGAWAHVKAWSHDNGQEAEGYLLLRQLEVLRPSGHYGVLIDKLDQTLTVFRDGKRIGTVPVSTGLVTPGNAYRETPAGAFLTDVHNGSSFAQEGYRYEYPIRYDGVNFIHGVGFTRSGRARDYSDHMKVLGQKASHGCIRVSSFLPEDSEINIYWLWTHLPYHTRVLILYD